MKRSLIVVALLVCGMAGAYAQAQIAIGLKAGANFSKVSTDAVESTSNITSFSGGAFALFKLTKFGIQPELLYSQQGSKIEDIDLGKVDLKTNYISIPVMLKIYLAAGLNVQVGPQFGFLSVAELDGQDIKSDLKNSDISANLGLGWDLPFGLMVEGRYNLGLSDINDMGGPSIKSNVIQFTVGYKIFKLGK